MKQQIKYIFCAGVGMVLFSTSCKKEYLNPIPLTSITDVTAFETPARIANQVNALYSALKSGSFYGGRAQIAGDIRGEDFINETTNGVTGYDVWLMNPTGTSQNFIKNCWSQAYYTINLCNLFIDGMAAKGTAVVGATLSNNYLGEAKLVRALCYYWMLQFYAKPYADNNGGNPGLPLRLTGIKGSGFSDLARAKVSEVYTQIISDLNFAEQNLPLDYTGTSQASLRTTRAHRNTAIALKTRVYLAMQQYTNVITEANKIVSTNAPFTATTGVPHALSSNIVNVFRTPYTSVESILSMPMTSTAGDYPGTQNQLGFYWSKTTGNGEFSLNPSGIYADAGWTATDARRGFNAVVSGKPYLNTKFNAPSPYTDWAPVIRYSEVLLNLAEALARTNTTGVDARALALLNAVRQRSDPATVLAPTTQAALISMILNERRIEFLGEGLRDFDVVRLMQTFPAKGTAPSVPAGPQPYIWPISSDEMSLNHLMTDN
ncbi:MAG: RagB/SusD family nutrient uptake outer membrane protein [Flavisolibacter sp.]